MQEAGEPLRPQYTKAPYGPNAENLRHVLRTIEGHLVSGIALETLRAKGWLAAA